MGIKVLIIILIVPLAIVLPEFPVEALPRLLQLGWCEPIPCLGQIIAIPDEKMGKCSAHSKVGRQQLHDPCTSIEWLEDQINWCEMSAAA